jgi:hypothetical protein
VKFLRTYNWLRKYEWIANWHILIKIGTGEYTTGFVGGGMSGSDKKVGVVGLTLFDLRRRGKVGQLGMVGVNGTKFPAIRMYWLFKS